jgi:hypothetical protein
LSRVDWPKPTCYCSAAVLKVVSDVFTRQLSFKK